MDGVNNAFCMSKEEYEMARLAAKCAGLQGKIDDQAAEIEKYQALCDLLGDALELGWSPIPRKGVDARELAMEALEAWREMK